MSDRVLEDLQAPEWANQLPVAYRRYDSAVHDRLTSSWMTTNALIDQELRGDLDRLRARSRDLSKNNEYIKAFLRAVRRNVVGPSGPVLQCRAAEPNGTPDRLANQVIETAWLRQMRRGNFEVTGRLSGIDALNVMITSAARDGELLYRELRGASFGEFGYQIQLLDVARIATDLNVQGGNGQNAIVMGVEQDEWGRPVAMHLYMAPALHGGISRQTQRIPVSEIKHAFIAEDAEQSRGVPWAHAAMKRLHDLNGYREAAVIAARVGASKMGMYVSQDGDGPPGTVEEHEVIEDVAPGTFGFVPKGYDFKSFDPAYPHDQFEAFNKAVLRGVSSAIGQSYNSLASDLEGVNFSSIRAGLLEERDDWMVIQEWLIAAVLVPMFEAWLEWSLLAGRLVMPNGSALPAAKLAKFRAHIWQAKRWPWVDPMKDIEAAILAVQHGLDSPQAIAARAGRDVEDILDDIAMFQRLAEDKKVRLPSTSYTPKPDPQPPA